MLMVICDGQYLPAVLTDAVADDLVVPFVSAIKTVAVFTSARVLVAVDTEALVASETGGA